MTASNKPRGPVPQNLPSAVAVRLEAVRLAHRFDKTAEQIIEVADPLARWILSGEGQADKP